MKIKMLVSCNGASNPEGSVSMVYNTDNVYYMSQPWQIKIANSFIASNLAIEVKQDEIKEVKKEVKKPKESLLSKVKKKITRKKKKVVL